jgi:hypothetical protein
MGILTDAREEVGHAKIGLLGFPGGGKTYTAILIAIGLAKEFSKKNPAIAMYDTERGSEWIRPVCDEAGVRLLVAKRRSFKDLMTFTREAEEEADVAIIDSVTHPWNELMEAACKRFHTKRLAFQHWAIIKPEWAGFADWVLNVSMHVLVCGRAGWEYEYAKNEETQKMEVHKAGIKMRVESQFGFEPSLVMEMQGVQRSALSGDLADHGLLHRCYILKDRSQKLEGCEFDNPTYKDFKPFTETLNPAKPSSPVDTESSSAEMLDDPDRSRGKRIEQAKILLEEIKNEFIRNNLGGRSKEEVKKRNAILRDCFGTDAWSAIEGMDLEALRGGLQKMRDFFQGKEAPGQEKGEGAERF